METVARYVVREIPGERVRFGIWDRAAGEWLRSFYAGRRCRPEFLSAELAEFYRQITGATDRVPVRRVETGAANG